MAPKSSILFCLTILITLVACTSKTPAAPTPDQISLTTTVTATQASQPTVTQAPTPQPMQTESALPAATAKNAPLK